MIKKKIAKVVLGYLKPKKNAFKGVESAGATKPKSYGTIKSKPRGKDVPDDLGRRNYDAAKAFKRKRID